MDKIGIITLNGYFNYGNRLQNYALQETLKSFGYEVETVLVDDRRLDMSTSEVIAKKLNILKEESLSGTFRIISKKLKDRLNQEAIVKRTKLFKDFTNRYISESKYKITQKGLDKEYEKTFSFFVAGSDQIWNPKYVNLPEIYFLTFTQKKKRIAYAASFGISNIPSEFKERYVKYLNGMNYISLRESDGAKIVEELTG
ncbi:MAG: polysaccharide pyruvyl transferase family protein, partial [Clostridia bacterium]|nr:polysaccharide pyruvyl transferase family protein [Clostridia bacterium]